MPSTRATLPPQRSPNSCPTNLSLRKGEAGLLEQLSYQRDPKLGYRLRLIKPGSEEMNLILTPKGIQYTAPGSTGG